MATDYTTRDLLRCPCGQGVVTLTSTSPDHLWARESQTTYSATIECIACQEEFAVHQVSSNSRPQIVYRDELEAKEAIREEYWAADTAIQQSDQAKRLRPNIVVAVDNESSKAAPPSQAQEIWPCVGILWHLLEATVWRRGGHSTHPWACLSACWKHDILKQR